MREIRQGVNRDARCDGPARRFQAHELMVYKKKAVWKSESAENAGETHMAWQIIEKLGGMFARRADGPDPLGEVSVATCGLEDVDEAACARLNVGEELPLKLGEDGRVAVMRTRSKTQATVGYLPGCESPHVAKLMEGRATLGCRVVQMERGHGQGAMVRVRITIRM